MTFLQELYGTQPLIFDGAMGTMVFRKFPRLNGPIEGLNLENAPFIKEIHQSYIRSGARIIETNTFGASAIKLAEYGLDLQVEKINRQGAAIAREAAQGTGTFVAGALGPTGKLIAPMGTVPAEAVFASYRRQVRGLLDGGVDLFIVETMTDIQEARLALLAIREETGLPVIASLSFQENGKTITGTDMLTGFTTLAACGATGVAANCGLGPDGLVRLFERHERELRALGIPLGVWANAGLPEFIDGAAVYTLSPDAFAESSARLAGLGASIIGGCCGTSPEHIAALKRRLDGVRIPAAPAGRTLRALTSRTSRLDLEGQSDLLVIGERLNPSARKKFAEELRSGSQGFLREEARKQAEEGAQVLDINVGVAGIDEVAAMEASIATLSGIVDAPLMIDSDNPSVLERALLAYPGVPVINSINGKQSKREQILPLVKKYGCFVVALCLDETGIHRDADARIAIGDRLLEYLAANGVGPERVFIDPLMLSESAEPGSAMETLRVIEYYAKKGIRTSIGLSNISFGLPERKHINNAFLAMAVERGLRAAIVNPSSIRITPDNSPEGILASDFLRGNDPGAARYIEHFRKPAAGGNTAAPAGERRVVSTIDRIFAAVVEGNSDSIEELVRTGLREDAAATLMDRGLLAALTRVGELYTTGEYFLPQMIAAANAMKKGFAILRPLLALDASERSGKVVICTVHGDVHDIGKNIVAMMLENHGFTVIDLGKDVPSGTIMEALRREKADILCLSSLLTTTMNEMKVVSDAIAAERLDVKLLVGGAVVTESYAASIGAAYGKDAVEGVARAKELMAGK